jgi:hypothetical protein
MLASAPEKPIADAITGESGPAIAGPDRDLRFLLDNFHYAPGSWLHDHRTIVHDCISVTRPNVILARYRVKRYASGQQRADANLMAVPERRTVLVRDVFAKPRPLLDAEDAADGAGCGADGPADNRAERSSGSFARSSTLLGSADGSLCVRGQRHARENEGGNGKEFNLHDFSFGF